MIHRCGVAVDQVIDILGRDAGPLQARLYRMHSQSGQGRVAQRLAKVAQRRARAGTEDDVLESSHVLSPFLGPSGFPEWSRRPIRKTIVWHSKHKHQRKHKANFDMNSIFFWCVRTPPARPLP